LGQKVNPVGFRLGVIRSWDSRWFSRKDYAKFIEDDWRVREFLKKKLNHAGISKIEIERWAKRIRLRIHAARPGIIIGKKGSEIEILKKELERIVPQEVVVDIQEVRKPEVDAQLVAENVGMQIVRRVAFRRAMKRSVSSAMRFGAKGIKICCSGRLGGAEMARTEWYKEGRIPLHTLRADIDYGFAEAKTTYGIVGVKVWVFHGDILEKDTAEAA
jgi:small subunit ribosomal protein S3